VKISYRATASDDVVRQFRHYLLTLEVPEIAERFRNAVRLSIEALRKHPFLGSRFPLQNQRLQNLRVWPVAGFETLRIYYLGSDDAIVVIRILHSKRNVRRILERERV
jgi:toxin ParE1/3/4